MVHAAHVLSPVGTHSNDIFWYILHHIGDAKHAHIECLEVPSLPRLLYNTIICMDVVIYMNQTFLLQFHLIAHIL